MLREKINNFIILQCIQTTVRNLLAILHTITQTCFVVHSLWLLRFLPVPGDALSSSRPLSLSLHRKSQGFVRTAFAVCVCVGPPGWVTSVRVCLRHQSVTADVTLASSGPLTASYCLVRGLLPAPLVHWLSASSPILHSLFLS